MNFFNNAVASLDQQIVAQFSVMGFFDVVDILIVAYCLYRVVLFIRDTRAIQLVKGIVFLLVILQLSDWLRMQTINFLLRNTLQLGLIAVVIIFQPEFRRALEEMGRSRFKLKLFNFEDENNVVVRTSDTVAAVCAAAEYFSRNKIGATVVFERDTKIGEIIRSGTVLDAQVTGELIVSIFFPNNPLHDGALIIRSNRVHAAGCFLPLTQNQNLSKELGTRHRAAIGISENSDAFVVVVSEETGIISTVYNGIIRRNHSVESLKKSLMSILAANTEARPSRLAFWRGKK